MHRKELDLLTTALDTLEHSIRLEPWKKQPALLPVVEKLSGVREETIDNWLKGKSSPTMGNFIAVINACGFELTMRKIEE